MEQRLFEIADQLYYNIITEEEAKNLLLKMLSDEYEYLVKVENAYIEDSDQVGDYYPVGRVKELWVSAEDFDNIKHIAS